MTKLKKGLSLLAVVAFLITALVPAGALAANVGNVNITGASIGTITNESQTVPLGATPTQPSFTITNGTADEQAVTITDPSNSTPNGGPGLSWASTGTGPWTLTGTYAKVDAMPTGADKYTYSTTVSPAIDSKSAISTSVTPAKLSSTAPLETGKTTAVDATAIVAPTGAKLDLALQYATNNASGQLSTTPVTLADTPSATTLVMAGAVWSSAQPDTDGSAGSPTAGQGLTGTDGSTLTAGYAARSGNSLAVTYTVGANEGTNTVTAEPSVSGTTATANLTPATYTIEGTTLTAPSDRNGTATQGGNKVSIKLPKWEDAVNVGRYGLAIDTAVTTTGLPADSIADFNTAVNAALASTAIPTRDATNATELTLAGVTIPANQTGDIIFALCAVDKANSNAKVGKNNVTYTIKVSPPAPTVTLPSDAKATLYQGFPATITAQATNMTQEIANGYNWKLAPNADTTTAHGTDITLSDPRVTTADGTTTISFTTAADGYSSIPSTSKTGTYTLVATAKAQQAVLTPSGSIQLTAGAGTNALQWKTGSGVNPTVLLVGDNNASAEYTVGWSGNSAPGVLAGNGTSAGTIAYTWTGGTTSPFSTAANPSDKATVTASGAGSATLHVAAAPADGGSWTTPPPVGATGPQTGTVTVNQNLAINAYKLSVGLSKPSGVPGGTVIVTPSWTDPDASTTAPSGVALTAKVGNGDPQTIGASNGTQVTIPSTATPGSTVNCVVTASLNGQTATVTKPITVVAGASLLPSTQSGTNQLAAVFDPDHAQTLTYKVDWSTGSGATAPTNATYEWSSSNAAVLNAAGAGSGTQASVAIAGAGTATVTVKAVSNNDQPLDPAPIVAEQSFEVTVYGFDITPPTATLVTGHLEPVRIVPSWKPSPAPDGATVTVKNTDGATVGTTNADGSITIEPTATGTYTVTGAIGTTSVEKPFAVTVSAPNAVTVGNDTSAADNAASSAENAGNPTAGQTQENPAKAAIDADSVAAGQAVLQVTYVPGATYEATTQPAPASAAEEAVASDEGTISVPLSAGTYTIACEVQVPGAAGPQTVYYEVTVTGDLGASSSPDGLRSSTIPVPAGETVPLYPSWTSGGLNPVGAPAANQDVVYEWKLANENVGNLEQNLSADNSYVRYTGGSEDNSVTVTAYSTWSGNNARAARRTPIGTNTISLPATSFAWPATGGEMQYQTQNASPAYTGSQNGRLPESDGGTFTPATSGTASSFTVKANSRFELRVPDSVNWGFPANRMSFEWQYRTSGTAAAGGDGLAITQDGFYGVNSRWLRSAPVTAAMNGWQYRIVGRSLDNPGNAAAVSPWITVNVEGAPSTQEVPVVQIESSPVSAAANVPVTQTGDVTFTATVTNNIELGSLSYRWQSRPAATASAANPQWADIEGATERTLTVEDVQASQNGVSYRCVVTNGAFSTGINGTSNILTLQVNTAAGAVIITTPTAASLQNFFAGRTATFKAAGRTDNGDPVTYQWYRRGTPGPVSGGIINTTAAAASYLGSAAPAAVSGATEAEYTTPALEEGVYQYFCRVTNAANSSRTLDTSGFYVVVTQESRKPRITVPAMGDTDPQVVQVGTPSGQSVSMECKATVQSQEPLAYQWQASQGQSGPWADLQNQTAATFVLPGPTSANNGWYYRCVVTNAAAGEETASRPYQLTVWSAGSVPTVNAITPQTFEATWSGSTQKLELTSTASLASLAPSATWYLDGKPANLASFGADGSGKSYAVAATTPVAGTTPPQQKSTLTIQLATGSIARAVNGTWSCRWTNGTNNAYRDSGTCVVSVSVPGDPVITVQPVNATAAVGTSATFTVGASLTPDPTASPRGSLVYIWQRSQDGGQTWENCTAADGSGQFTSTFTVPVTETMYDNATAANVQGFANPYTYRVIVANSARGPAVVSNPESDGVTLTVTPGGENPPVPETPEITVPDGSDLTVTQPDGETNGLIEDISATADGTPLDGVLEKLEIPDGYELAVVQGDSKVDPDAEGAVAATGQQVLLVETATDETVATYDIVVRGDVLGTGRMSLTQLVRMAAAYRQDEPLTGPFLAAGDVANDDGAISLSDLVQEAATYRAECLPEPAPEA